MSSGQHHAGMTKGIASGIGLGAISSYFLTPVELSFMALGCLLGLFLGPDNDHDVATTHEQYVKALLGRPGLWVYSVLWYPYKIGIKHRSFWSHTPIVGTTVRLIYMVIPCIILLLKDQSSTSILELIPRSLLAQLVAIPFVAILATITYFIHVNTSIDLVLVLLSLLAGLCVADFGHWILDI